MLNKSIAYRLKMYISIAVIGVFVVFMIIFYSILNRTVNENINNKAENTSNKVITEVKKQLIATSEISSNIADQIIFYAQHNHSDLFFSNLMEKYQFLNAIHVNIDTTIENLTYHNFYCYREADSIALQLRNEEIHDCQYEKQLIDEVLATKISGWTDILRCQRNNALITSYVTPVYSISDERNQIVGEVVCELSLEQLNNLINSIDVGEDGFAFLISMDGRYMTHPNSEWIYTKSVLRLSDKVYDKKKIDIETVRDKGLTGSLISYPESKQYKKHWTYYTQIKETTWFLLVLVPYEELYNPLYMSVISMILIAIAGILIIYLTINYLANRLVEPLTNATAKLRKFASQSGHRFNTFDEVRLVSESLDFLKSWYEKFKIDQTIEEKESHKQMQDLLQASEIQQSLINNAIENFPENNVVDIKALYQPARIVSGDLFDFFFLDEDHLVFTMGDVSGKGVSAAFFMSIAQTIIKSNATFKGSSTIVRKANDELFTNNQHQFFLTLFLGVLNVKTGILDFCNAAHIPTYILKFNGEIEELSQTHGLPLGLYPNKKYAHSRIKIDTGDLIAVYTDGITELQNEYKIQFGQERFIENLKQLINVEPEKLVDRIDKSLKVYKGEADQVDDITFMAIRYNGIKKT